MMVAWTWTSSAIQRLPFSPPDWCNDDISESDFQPATAVWLDIPSKTACEAVAESFSDLSYDFDGVTEVSSMEFPIGCYYRWVDCLHGVFTASQRCYCGFAGGPADGSGASHRVLLLQR